MEIIIRCPNCGMELEAPDEMVGRPALCPGCQRSFVVQAVDESEITSAPAPAAPTTSPASTSAPASNASASSSSTKSSTESSADAASSGKPRFKGLDPGLLAELGGGSAPASTPTPSASTSSSSARSSSSATTKEPKPLDSFEPAPVTPVRNDRPTRRERKTAKLITSTNDNSRLTLGADGQLPELVIKEASTTEKKTKEDQESSPVMLIVALAVSVAMSLLLLFVPTQSRSSKTDVADALAALQEHYIGTRQPLEPYQMLVRKAIQAENKGDVRTAVSAYSELLQMLHEERPNENQGLTGPRYSTREPNDRQLEIYLRTLLAR